MAFPSLARDPNEGLKPSAGKVSSGGSTGARHWLRCFALIVQVHLDAFLMDPRAYLQALAWRLRGLKLRARNRIAPLAGRSPCAYALWIARHESFPRVQPSPSPPRRDSIYPVIDCRRGGEGLDQTLASLAGSSKRVILIGGSPQPGTERVETPAELASVLPATGAWLFPVPPGDRLAPDALAAYAKAIDEVAGARIIYADDDLLDSTGHRTDPHFKPDWNPDLFGHHDFITGASALSATPGQLGRVPEWHWAETLVREVIEAGVQPVHLRLVLHHRKSRPQPTVPGKPQLPNPQSLPNVTAIIPTRDNAALLRCCVEGLAQAVYPKVELIVIDNGSEEPQALAYLRELERSGASVLRMPGPFNYSALNNEAVRHSSGSMLCFLNNDVEMLDRDWLSILVSQALRPEIGAVGARLLYPDRTIQHAGVFLGIGGGAGHGHRFLREDEPGYFQRARLPQQVSAVTAACLVVARDKFVAAGGFDERNFPIAFNDVDLCLKLNELGWQSFYEPRATLLHHESKSRGSDSARHNRARFAGELAALKQKWHTDILRDPYHHPELSPFSEQFVVAV